MLTCSVYKPMNMSAFKRLYMLTCRVFKNVNKYVHKTYVNMLCLKTFKQMVFKNM